MNDVFLTQFGIGCLIPALFAGYLAIFFATMRDRSRGGTWLLVSFAAQALFYGAYVPAYSLLDSSLAFHRWFTIAGVFPGMLAVVAFVMEYPEPLHRWLRVPVLGLLLSLFLGSLLFFMAQSLHASRELIFQVHGWDFRLERLSARIGVIIGLGPGAILIASAIRMAQGGRANRTVAMIGLCFFAGTVAAAVTNLMSRDGALDRGIHQVTMSLSSLTAFFVAFILFLNTSKERTTFMAKIVGVSVVTFLLLFQFVSFFALKDQEVAYDTVRQGDLDLVLAGLPPSGKLRYATEHRFLASSVTSMRVSGRGPGLPSEKVGLAEARNTLALSRVRRLGTDRKAAAREYQTKGERLARTLDSIWSHLLGPGLTAAPAVGTPSAGPGSDITGDLIALLDEFEHPHFTGYRGLILGCAGLPATARAGDVGLRATGTWAQVVECIDDHRRPVLVLSNQIRRMDDSSFRADLARALGKVKGDLVPFALAMREHIGRSKSEGAALKAEVLPFVAPMQPAGTRLYRMHTSSDLNADPFTAFLHVDLEKNVVYEAGFSYREYRAFIHPTALKLTIILLIGLAVILVGYRIFFAGALLAPLQQLLDGVKRVNRGHLDTKVPVKVADEIGFLSESFNSMMDTIRDARDNLERKVADRTEELQGAYDKLKELDALKTNFFANVSHELRTPLTLMLTPMESLIGGELGPVNDGQKQFLLSAHRNGQKLLKLISNLLDFSKLEAGRLSLSYRELNFVEYVRGLAAAFDSSARAAGISIAIDARRDRIMAFFDPERMEKIVLNLLSNAFKFTDHGTVSVEIDEENGIVQLHVRDTGIGIPADKLEQVFERFTQVDGSASRRFEGTGIGLALARELAQAHQGKLVAVESEKGAHFVLTFPRVPEEMRKGERAGSDEAGTDQATPESSPSPSPSPSPAAGDGPRKSSTKGALLAELQERQTVTLGNEEDSIELVVDHLPAHRSEETVLIVEDTHDMRKLLYFLLTPHYRLVTARNGREGLEKARRLRPDLILSDIMMPEMNGYELTLAVRRDADLRNTPVVLLSAKADVGMRVQGLDQGADDYVVKPFNSAELLSRIRGQLRIRSMQREIVQMRDRLQDLNEKLAGQVQLQVSELLLSEKFRNYLPPQLVDQILRKEGDAHVSSERKKLTIFFSDIVDFTRITDELEPEDLASLLNHYLSEMTRIAKKHDAVVDKFIGDALLCHFGAVASRGERGDAEAAVAMAVEMQMRMRELSAHWIEQGFSEPLQIRCGLTTGFAAVGNFGSDERVDYTVIGSQVNLASRIQAHAEPGGILLSHSTWALVNRVVRTEPAGDIQPKGFRRTFPVYRVLL